MRTLVLLALLLMQEPDVDALLKQLEDDDFEKREKATQALKTMGEKAEPALRRELARASGGHKVQIERLLETIELSKTLGRVFPPLKRVTLSAKDAPLADVLRKFQDQCGVELVCAKPDDIRVTVDVKDATPMEAFVALCRAGNLGFGNDSLWAKPAADRKRAGAVKPFVLKPGAFAEAPRQVTRHYLVEPWGLAVNRSDTFRGAASRNANLGMALLWLPGTAPAEAHIDIESIIDDKGRRLDKPASGPTPLPKSSSVHSRFGMEFPYRYLQGVSIEVPEPDAERIDIKGKVRILYALKEHVVRFDPATDVGVGREFDGLTVHLREFTQAAGSATLKLGITGKRKTFRDPVPVPPYSSDQIRVRTKDGALLPRASGTEGDVDSEYILTQGWNRLASPVASIEIVLDTTYHEDSFDFEVKGAKLPK